MTIGRPSAQELANAAEHFGFHLDADAQRQYLAAVGHTLKSFDAVDALYDQQVRPAPPERRYRFPEPDANPLGAWYLHADIASGAEGPLSGRRVVIKDNIAVAGIPMMNGSRSVEGFVPSRDATVVERLMAAGATIAGKSVCEDLCCSGSSFTSASGPVRNPWDVTRETGGSSSGSGALVAAGEVELALGGDQGGSIRVPASLCGVVGHKPTHGLVPYTGAFPIDRTIDHLGPMTRTVADAALLLTILAGADGRDPRQSEQTSTVDYRPALTGVVAGLRVGILREGFSQPGAMPEVDELVRSAVHRFTELGCAVEEVSVPWHRDAWHVFTVIFTDGPTHQMLDGNGYGVGVEGFYDPELMAHFAQQRARTADQLAGTVKAMALCGHYDLTTRGGASYAKARELLPHVRAAYDAALGQYDVLALPTVPRTAERLPDDGREDAELVQRALGTLINTGPFDITGHPAISVPAGMVDGLPAGMMLVGKRFDDATVLRAAHAFESLHGGFPAAPRATECPDTR